MMSVMFKITHNSMQRFSLAEILIMAAMNKIEATQKSSSTTRGSEKIRRELL
jgi:hypothetical protein